MITCNLHDFLRSVREVLLDLAVGELEHLQAISVCGLRGSRLGEVVDDLAVRIGLLDVAIVEVYDGVAVAERLPTHSIAEDDFLLAVGVRTLHLAIVTHDALGGLSVLLVSVVVPVKELHLVILLFFVHVVGWLAGIIFMLIVFVACIVVLLLVVMIVSLLLDGLILVRLACSHLLADLLLLILELFHARLKVTILVAALASVQSLAGAAATALALLSAASRSASIEHTLSNAGEVDLVLRASRHGLRRLIGIIIIEVLLLA